MCCPGAPQSSSTCGVCHLDADAVHRALHQLALAELDLVFIENVVNLVCPAGFDLGQHRNVTLLSVTEGDDKPANMRARDGRRVFDERDDEPLPRIR
jgi:hydrogenase nickel incorporation protein HypB